MPKIGPTFGAELIAAGCNNGITWNTISGVLTFAPHTADDGLTDAQYAARAAAQQAVLAAHNPAQAIPVNLVAYAASARYTRETAGLMVAGSQIATDRDSQGLINGAYNYVLAKPDATIRFKGMTGWTTLTADQVQVIALAVGSYVQACFAAEGQIDDGITAGTITTTAQIDAVLAAVGA